MKEPIRINFPKCCTGYGNTTMDNFLVQLLCGISELSRRKTSLPVDYAGMQDIVWMTDPRM